MEETIQNALPFWDSLTDEQKELILSSYLHQDFNKGAMTHHSSSECSGLEIVKEGRVRVFINSPNGGEITLFRLLPDDVCILSAACMLKNLDMEISMEAEEDSEIVVIPKGVYKMISDNNPEAMKYTLSLVTEKFSEVMWLFNQYVFSNMANRLADALLNHVSLCGSYDLLITHDALAKDLGTAREVVTRLLKQFQTDGILTLGRGRITINDPKKLRKI